MALKISEDDCTSCGACESECPNSAISEGDNGYVIETAKCNECEGHADSPQCQDVCPVEAIAK